MPAFNPPSPPPPAETGRVLLPVPTQEDADGFVALYRKLYGVELSPEKAHEILGGLMRFYYLTGIRGAEGHGEDLDTGGDVGHEPSPSGPPSPERGA